MSGQAELMEVALRLRAISRGDGSIDAAQVRVLGLDEIREAAGKNWPRMRERVRTGSFSILSKFTNPDDVIVPAGDGFLVVLAEGAPGDNQDRCRKMREALLHYYLGEEAMKSLTPEVTARSLSADGFADLVTATAAHGDAARGPTSNLLKTEIGQIRLFATKERRVVGRWFCPVRHERGTRRAAYNPDFILDGAHRTETDFLDVDLALLDCVSDYCRQNGTDEQLVVGVTVHASTMQRRRSREAYLAQLAIAHPEFLRRGMITIAEIERGAPLISIAEWCSALRTLVKRVCVDMHYTDHAITSIGATGAWAAGFHLPIYSGAQKGPRAARTLDHLQFWSRAVHGQGMRLAVNGFTEPEFVEAACAAGLDIASSDVLWPFQLHEAEEAVAAA